MFNVIISNYLCRPDQASWPYPRQLWCIMYFMYYDYDDHVSPYVMGWLGLHISLQPFKVCSYIQSPTVLWLLAQKSTKSACMQMYAPDRLLLQTAAPPLPLADAVPVEFYHMTVQSALAGRSVSPHHSGMGPSPGSNVDIFKSGK